MSEIGEIYTAGKNFTLPPAVTASTNVTSVSICLVIFQTQVTIFNLDQHSTQGNYLGQIFSPVSYHRPIIRNTNILSNSRTAHYLRPNVFNFSRTPQSAINAMSALQGMLGINQVQHRFGLTLTMITIFRETSRVC